VIMNAELSPSSSSVRHRFCSFGDICDLYFSEKCAVDTSRF